MTISKSRKKLKTKRLQLFEEALEKQRHQWVICERLTEFQYKMDYNCYSSVPVNVYPSTLTLVTHRHESVTCFSIEHLLAQVKRYSLQEDE